MPEPMTIAAVVSAIVSSKWFQEGGRELAKGALNGFAKGFMENKVKEWSKPQTSSSAIVQQTKEQAKWIQAQSEYLKRREEREKRALEFKHEELQLQQQDLQDRRELAHLQRELMRELHAEAVEVKLTEIQTIWDLENWPSKLNREDTKDILRNGQQQYRLLMLASPPKISEGCPESFYNYLEMEIQSNLETFLDRYYPLNSETDDFSPCPVEFYEDYFKEPISGRTQLKQLHGVLAPVPTVVLYSRIVNDEVHFRMGNWGLYRDEVSPVSMQPWNWKQACQELEKAGVDKDESLLIIRQIIVMIHKLSAAFVADLYYLYIDSTASYEPRLFEFEKEFAREWFPQELVKDFIEMLREVQQRQRDVYEAELERMAKFPPWELTSSIIGFDKDLHKLVGISADGSRLVGERSDGKTRKALSLQAGKPITGVELWQSDIGELLRTEEGHSRSINFIAFSADGQLLASSSDDRTIKLWEFHTGKLLRTLEGHSSSVKSVTFSTDGQLLASGSFHGSIKLWHLHTGKLLRTLEGHSLSVKSLSFSADGQILASASCDNTIKLWHPHTGELLDSQQKPLFKKIQYLREFTKINQYSTSDSSYWSNFLVGSALDFFISPIATLVTEEETSTWKGHIAFSTNGKLLASGSEDNTIKLWNPHTGELLRTLSGHSKDVCSFAFSTDGKILASGSEDNTIKLWHLHTGELLRTLEGHSKSVTSVSFNPDGQLLASGSEDKTIKLWHPHTGELLDTLKGHSSIVECVAFSPEGRLLVSGSSDYTIKIWHPHHRNPLPANCKFPVTSPDRSLLVKPNYDETTETWNLETIEATTDKPLQTLPGHSGSIQQVIFSEDGNTMVSLGGDLVIKVWRRGDG